MSLNDPATPNPEEQKENTAPAAESAPETEEDPFAAFSEPVRPEKKKAVTDGKKHLSRRVRTLLIAVVATVLLVGILLLILILPDGESESSSSSVTETTIYTMLDKSTKDTSVKHAVTGLNITNADGQYSISVNGSGDYQLDGYTDLELNSTTMQSLTNAAATLTSETRIEGSNLADYGLEAPLVTAVLHFYDGSSATLLIGADAPSGSGSYACIKDSGEIYLLDTTTVGYFKQKAGSLISTTLMTAPTAKSDDSDGKAILRELTISGTSHPEPLSVRRINDSDGSEYTYFSYIITKPYYNGTNDTASTTLSAFTSLIADSAAVLHPTAAQKAELGFNNPYALLKLEVAVETSATQTAADGTETTKTSYYNPVKTTLTVGSRTDSGDYYVMVDGHPVIYLVSSGTLSGIAELTYDTAVSSTLFLKDITTLGRVEVTDGDMVSVFNLTHNANSEENDDKMTVTCDGKKLSTADFRTLYQLMMGLSRYESLNAMPDGSPAASVVLYDLEGKEYLRATFYVYGANLYAVKTSRGEMFTVKASVVTNFLKQKNKYIQGQTVLGN